jgi:hypothetical protein
MRRTPWFRLLATLLAVWFPLIAGEPGVLHLCPMHGGKPVATAHPTAHAHHAVSASTEITSNNGGSPAHDHHCCTCIASCTSTTSALPIADAPTILAVEIAQATTAPASVVSVPRPAAEYSRPYTTGPPRGLRGAPFSQLIFGE